MPAPKAAELRFWKYVSLDGAAPAVNPTLGPCWPWLGARSTDGYGHFSRDRKALKAHRFAYELLVGPIPEGLEIDHLCHVRPCVNPDHLAPATHAENVARQLPRTRAEACAEGHAFTDENTGYHHGRRYCRECNRAAQRRRYHAAKAVA